MASRTRAKQNGRDGGGGQPTTIPRETHMPRFVENFLFFSLFKIFMSAFQYYHYHYLLKFLFIFFVHT